MEVKKTAEVSKICDDMRDMRKADERMAERTVRVETVAHLYSSLFFVLVHLVYLVPGLLVTWSSPPRFAVLLCC